MRLVYTRHALDKMAERRLAEAWVERAAREEAWVRPSPTHSDRVLRHPIVDEAHGKVLVRVTPDQADVRYIVTAHFDDAATRRHRRSRA